MKKQMKLLMEAIKEEELEPKIETVKTLVQIFCEKQRAEDLIEAIENCYDDSPASSQFHHVAPYGCADHTLEILAFGLYAYEFAPEEMGFSLESFVTVAILHDIDKFGFYELKMVKATKEWRREYADKFGLDIQKDDDEIPRRMPSRAVKKYFTTGDENTLIHPSGALYLSMKYVDLTEEEASAIDNHMLGYDPRTKRIRTPNKLSYFLGICDMLSANILGRV